MLEPADREIVGCRTCRDFRKVYDRKLTVDCPECACWTPEKRNDMLKEATRRNAEKPSITEADLSDQEKALVEQWSDEHPNVHKLTLLTWIEGRRYDPANDPEFLAEARKRFRKWKFLRNTNEGPVPGWAQNALRTGDRDGLSKSDVEYVNSLEVTR